jgi:hypothetical protein
VHDMHDTIAVATANDFEFFMGRWKVRNRRLRERLAGAEDWEEFEATSVARPLFDGCGNEDEFRTEHDGGMTGMSFRFLDPETGLWSIYWADSRRLGQLDPPVFGSFADGIGIFEGDDRLDGRPIRVRFTWTRIATRTPRWEQAFSADGGETWLDNWYMDATRRP